MSRKTITNSLQRKIRPKVLQSQLVFLTEKGTGLPSGWYRYAGPVLPAPELALVPFSVDEEDCPAVPGVVRGWDPAE